MGRLYDRRLWKRLRASFLRANPLCVMCQAEGITRAAEDVDHIKTLSDGGDALDFANMRALCHSHHAQVTAAWKRGLDHVPIKGCNERGEPNDPAHWWRTTK